MLDQHLQDSDILTSIAYWVLHSDRRRTRTPKRDPASTGRKAASSSASRKIRACRGSHGKCHRQGRHRIWYSPSSFLERSRVAVRRAESGLPISSVKQAARSKEDPFVRTTFPALWPLLKIHSIGETLVAMPVCVTPCAARSLLHQQ